MNRELYCKLLSPSPIKEVNSSFLMLRTVIRMSMLRPLFGTLCKGDFLVVTCENSIVLSWPRKMQCSKNIS